MEEEAEFGLRSALLELLRKHEQAQQGVDFSFHEAALRAADRAFDGKGLFLVDSFEGLSAMHPADAVAKSTFSMRQGHFGNTSVEHVRGVMADYPGCEILKGWIPQVLQTLPECEWAFVHL